MTPSEFAAEKLAGRIAPEANYRDGWATRTIAYVEQPTCLWVVYAPSKIPTWPHLEKCGRPATTTGTYENNRGKTVEQPRCKDHEECS